LSEEFRQTYRLAPGARLEVKRVANGSFVILPADGDSAEVRIIRSVRTGAGAACERLVVEQTGEGLALRGDGGAACRGPLAALRQSVVLRVPRHADVSLSDIHGAVILGEAEGRGPNYVKGPDGRKVEQPADRPYVIGRGFSGSVRINRIDGAVRFIQGAGDSEVSDVRGPLAVSVRGLGGKGLDVQRVGGTVELTLSDDINAELEVQSIKGQVKYERGGVYETTGRSELRERLGNGGAQISVSRVEGNVLIRR
jgi:bifunctional DNA-binding transcriptional regulator/antitoxin component of YhaV-PrlF toxin-antitoxin module